jgi:hypothetical protein
MLGGCGDGLGGCGDALGGCGDGLGGCGDGTAIRSILEAGRWLVHSGTQHLQETQKLLAQEIWANAKGGSFFTEKFRHNMPGCEANSFEQRSWVSGGWASPS